MRREIRGEHEHERRGRRDEKRARDAEHRQSAGPGQRRRAPEREDASDVIARLAIGRDAPVLLDRVLSRVVRREDQVRVRLAESLGELGEVGRARPDVLPRVERRSSRRAAAPSPA